VGDAPPFLQEVRGGVRHEVATPPGAVPPREVLVPVPQGGKANEEAGGKLRLSLGRVSEAVLVAAGPVVLSAARADGAPARWTQITMPQHAAALAIIFRDPRGKSWDSARSLVLGDGLASFPAGSVRLVNVSPFDASASFQGKNTLLKPGQVLLKPPAAGAVAKDEPLLVAVRDATGRTARIFDSAIAQPPGERTNVVIHWADGENPRRPAEVLVLRERPVPREVPGPK
jgi:hypothetical protein